MEKPKISSNYFPLKLSTPQPYKKMKESKYTEKLTVQKILIEWSGQSSEGFLKDISFSSGRDDVEIHLFATKEEARQIQSSLTNKLKEYCTIHESMTATRNGPWTDLLAYIFLTKGTIMKCQSCLIRKCQSCSKRVHSKPQHCHLNLATSDEEKYKETKALLAKHNIDVAFLNINKQKLLDIFPYVCPKCSKIFEDLTEVEIHDSIYHNHLCKNRYCMRSYRQNGFYTQTELKRHESQQMKCEFCQIAFCDLKLYVGHMKKCHIMCQCPCGMYYENMKRFVKHYAKVCPLPCLEDPQCCQRFKNIDEQAFHHRTHHGAYYPYYCIACYGNQKLVSTRSSNELIEHIRNTGHQDSEFEIIIFPVSKQK